ncbi:uncharacterized protein LOC133378264 isoform X2 [Rhineura floridana]|nr:uncharacterized protein LOC133378264 isoform X2 [Rhineura floridana]
MEPLLTEMYGLHGQTVPVAQPMSDRREMVSGLPWERKGNCKGMMRGESSYQKKKKKLTQQLLEARVCEDHLTQGEECSEQGSLEVQRALQQETKGEKCHFQGGDLLPQKEGVNSGNWRLDFESESIHEEIYWGCFYFFPWLRMCRRDKKEQP